MSTYGGDSFEPEHQLQKKRQIEILGELIPDTEAIRSSNGRYICVVCPWRPFFDTIQVLSIHRNGKKHREQIAEFKRRKNELEERKRKVEVEKLLGSSARLGVSRPSTSVSAEGDNSSEQHQQQPDNNIPSSTSASQGVPYYPPGYYNNYGYNYDYNYNYYYDYTNYYADPSTSSETATGSATATEYSYPNQSDSSGTEAQGTYYQQSYEGASASSSITTENQQGVDNVPPQEVALQGEGYENSSFSGGIQEGVASGTNPNDSIAYNYESYESNPTKKQRTDDTEQSIDHQAEEQARHYENLYKAGYRWDANGNMYKDEFEGDGSAVAAYSEASESAIPASHSNNKDL